MKVENRMNIFAENLQYYRKHEDRVRYRRTALWYCVYCIEW